MYQKMFVPDRCLQVVSRSLHYFSTVGTKRPYPDLGHVVRRKQQARILFVVSRVRTTGRCTFDPANYSKFALVKNAVSASGGRSLQLSSQSTGAGGAGSGQNECSWVEARN